MGAAASCVEQEREYPVRVHVYNVGGGASLLLSAVGGGGVYHSGVEINGVEYAFGDKSGVWTQPPTQLPPTFGTPATYVRAEECGAARLKPAQLRAIMRRLKNEWPATRHQLVTCNCNHFSAAVCAALGAAPPPSYLNQLANTGAAAASMVAGLGAMASGLMDAAAQAHEQSTRQAGRRIHPAQ